MAYGKEDQTTGGIEFKNVSFSYGSEKVLDNISFKVNRGETVALGRDVREAERRQSPVLPQDFTMQMNGKFYWAEAI